MQIASFRIGERQSYGVVSGDSVIEASDALRQQFPDLRAVLDGDALALLASDEGGVALSSAQLEFLPTIPNPDKVLCVGINYRPHVEEMGREMPNWPMIFVRFPGSQVGHRQPLIRPAASEKYDFEGELAVVIGRRARNVPRSAADDVIAGYCCFMDGSARDWQNHTSQFTPGKNFDRSGSMGPYLVTRDEVPDAAQLKLETTVNGVVMQSGCLDELIFDIPALIEYCSTFTELLPGDVIATGTPGGVGAARKPPVWLGDGDRVSANVEGVGRLENPVGAV